MPPQMPHPPVPPQARPKAPTHRSARPLDQILTAEEMGAAERALMQGDGAPDDAELMRRAGEGAAQWIWRMAAGRPVTVLCGPGNNGGDGYVIAQAIVRRGGTARVVAPIAPKTDIARAARTACTAPIAQDARGVSGAVWVDCLFGHGLSRPLSDDLQALVADLDAAHTLAVALDLPSGVDSDDGECLNPVPDYDCTLALGAWKVGHFTGPGALRVGTLQLVDIGVDRRIADRRLLPVPHLAGPAPDAHKYRRGLLAVVGGAMPGAGLLAARAAMGAGAGYVKLLADRSHPDAPADLVIERTPIEESLADERIDAVLIGPGQGRDYDARDRLSAALERGGALVLDADALHLLDPDLLEGVDTAAVVVTPHEGELAALCEAFDVAGDTKLARARALHHATGMTVLAKGPDTVLAGAGGLGFFPRGPRWLSTAGTGDVLAGILASRVATGRSAWDAAADAVHLHALAARLAGPAFSAEGLAHCVRRAYARCL